jgi:LysM repeat protein
MIANPSGSLYRPLMQHPKAIGTKVWFMAMAISALNGCAPTGDSAAKPESDADFRRGQSLVSKFDYPRAERAFKRALVTNPDSSPAHLELAFLYKDHEVDPAGAIHHFGRYLELAPDTDQSKLIHQHMDFCKMELAKQFLIAPVVPSVQRELNGLKDELKRLQIENAALRGEINRVKSIPPQLEPIPDDQQGLRPLVPLAPPAPMLQTRTARPAPVMIPASLSKPSPKYHEVRNGDYPEKIARYYGIPVKAILAANPRVDPRRLKIGTRLKLPR